MSDGDRFHFDSSGKLIGRTKSAETVATEGAAGMAVLAVGAVVYAIYRVAIWMWTAINSFASLSMPYNAIACFYYIVIALPLKCGQAIFSLGLSLTAYPNLNAVVAYGALLVYVGAIGAAVYWAVWPSPARRVRSLAAMFIPAGGAAVWYLATSLLQWLFVKG